MGTVYIHGGAIQPWIKYSKVTGAQSVLSLWRQVGNVWKYYRHGDDNSVDKRGRKRLSKVIRKLSGRFEEGEEDHNSQPEVKCRSEREDILTFSNSVNGVE